MLYTFSPAKVLAAKQATAESNTAATMWRFEHSADIVPSLPPDSSVRNLLPAYGFSPSPPGSTDPVIDFRNLTQAVDNQTELVQNLFDRNSIIAWSKKLSNLLSDSFASLVNKHFIVFNDGQEIAHADASFAPDIYILRDEDLDKSFFTTGLFDAENSKYFGAILSGAPYCAKLNPNLGSKSRSRRSYPKGQG